MPREYINLICLTIFIVESSTMMMRNDALISKMVSNFQKDKPKEPRKAVEPEPKNIVAIMQSVLCKTFPTIPCNMIVKDETLQSLIERSIQQLKYKKLSMEKTTTAPMYQLTLYPTINSEDLSNFLQISDTGYYPKDTTKRTHKHRNRILKHKEEKENKKKSTKNKDNQRSTSFKGPKKLRKFYPHKIKYKDKVGKAKTDRYRDNTEERRSVSEETPEQPNRKRITTNFNIDSPVWRIDYTRHGEPGINMFNYEPDILQEKLAKAVPSVGGQNVMEVARKDVLPPDVYIKKNYIRKNGLDLSSGVID